MADAYDTVRSYYDRDPQREWDRLSRHRFEFPVTMHFLSKYMTSSSTVLDVGGGPGRYALELTRLGHIVDLFDLSPAAVDFARRMAQTAGVTLNSYHVGNAIDLGRFPSASYDTVLNMGPLYHLVEAADREATLRESIRVLKPGGLLVASFLSTFAYIYDILNKDPGVITERPALSESCRHSRSYLESQRAHFTDSYVIDPFEVETLMGRFPLQKLAVIGAEGIVAQSEKAIIQTGAGSIQEWVSLCKDVADTREAIGSSIHIVYLGRKLNR